MSPEFMRITLFEQCNSHRSTRIVILMLSRDLFLYKYPTRAAQPPHCNIQSFSPKNTYSSLPKFIITKMNPISTFVYYNGRIFNGEYGITFEGSHKGFRIRNRNISFRSLKQKITEKLELGSNHIISSITFRFLASPNPPVYTTLSICDDDDVELMIESFEQNSLMTMMEFYVETAEVGGSSIPVSTYPVNTPPMFTSEASDSRQVEEIIPSAAYEIV